MSETRGSPDLAAIRATYTPPKCPVCGEMMNESGLGYHTWLCCTSAERRATAEWPAHGYRVPCVSAADLRILALCDEVEKLRDVADTAAAYVWAPGQYDGEEHSAMRKALKAAGYERARSRRA